MYSSVYREQGNYEKALEVLNEGIKQNNANFIFVQSHHVFIYIYKHKQITNKQKHSMLLMSFDISTG